MKLKCFMLIYLRTFQFCVQIEEMVLLKPLPHGWKISKSRERHGFKLARDLIISTNVLIDQIPPLLPY